MAPLVTVLATCGAGVDARGQDGWVPLQLAVMNGRLRAADALLKHGADKTVRDSNADTLIWWAARNDQLPAVRLLLARGADLKEQDKSGDRLIVFAAKGDKLALVKLLLESGADPNDQIVEGSDMPPPPPAEEPAGEGPAAPPAGPPGPPPPGPPAEKTPLLVYAVKNQKPELAKLLLEHKANPNVSDWENSALCHAAEIGNADLVRLLVASGAQVNEDAKRRYTPLHIAAQKGRLEIVKLLVEKGADVNAITPFYLEVFGDMGLVHIGHGDEPAHTRWQIVEDITPLSLALQGHHADVASVLRAHGAKQGKKYMALE